ncbi:MAG TPA: hypothetical protein VJ673_06580 [Aromatoleum sp.]|uniref:hypothetical protein n=1 Tax=Aromatoleum sp. TaxID=2307007 RepID=UPI002B476F13|nr:hypothetical protein [Aromatoleum sp.]HJV25332.1 hypothetical protein [Aromatoleum sp.]
MAKAPAAPGQIWQDDCYYLDQQTGECRRKFVVVLAVDGCGDALTAVFTSKPNGLTENPACSLGPPRAGYFVGVPGGQFPKPTWVDFSSLEMLDVADLELHVATGRTRLLNQKVQPPTLCAILRCLLQSDDITGREARLLGDIAAALKCP